MGPHALERLGNRPGTMSGSWGMERCQRYDGRRRENLGKNKPLKDKLRVGWEERLRRATQGEGGLCACM